MKPKPLPVFLFLLVTGFLIYLPVINTTFFADDFYVLNRLQKGIFSAGNLFRPLSDISIYLDYLLWGDKATGFHVTSIIFHIITSFFVYSVFNATSIFLQLKSAATQWPGVLAGLFFLVYPFHNEAVVWIVGRGVILATLCCLVALRLYLVTGRRNWHYGAALFFYFMALFGYESVLLFPFLLMALEVAAARGKFSRQVVKNTYPFILVLLFYLAIRVYCIGSLVGASEYFRVTFTPLTLVVNFFRLFERTFMLPLRNYQLAIVLALLVFIAALLVLVFSRKKVNGHVFVLIMWAVMYVLGTLPFVTLGIDTHTTEGERFLYFSSVFFVGLLVTYIYTIAPSLKRNSVLFFAILCYFVFFLFQSNSNWQKSSALISVITKDNTQYNSGGSLYIIDMPDNINGALTLRNGFTESFSVLGRPLQVKDSIIVLSRKRLNDYVQAGMAQRLRDSILVNNRFLIWPSTGNMGAKWILRDWQTRQDYMIYAADKIFFFDGASLQPVIF